jgi:hypothetical protein
MRALLDSTLFRNVVAAGLAAAAAALVSRGSGPSNDLTQPTPARDDPHRGEAQQAKSPTLTSKVRRKAKIASEAVADAAESVSVAKTGAKVARKATKTAKAAKAALTASTQDSKTARNDQSIAAPPQQRTRKVRSDAGIQRQRPRVPAATPEVTPNGDLPVLAQTETSTLALDAATTSVDEVAVQSSEELAAGAHPS